MWVKRRIVTGPLIMGLLTAWSTVQAEPDRHLQRTARDIIKYTDEISALWPGYWDNGQGFVLYDASGEALVAVPNCDDVGLAQFDDYKTHALCEHQVDFGVDEAPFVRLVVLGGKTLPGARQSFYAERLSTLQSLFWQRALQMMQSWTLEVKRQNLKLGELTPEMVAAIHIERELLSRALSFTRPRESEQSLIRFLAARLERAKIMSPEQMRYQHQLEWRDGVATWLTGRALGIIEDISPERIGVAFALNLKTPLRKFEELTYVFENRLYAYTGGSLIELLVRQGFPIYKATEAGFSPFDILNYAYDSSTIDTKALVDEVVSEQYREDILQRARQAVDGQRDVTAIMAKLQEQGPYWVEFRAPFSRHVEYKGFYRSNLPDGSVVYRNQVHSVLTTDTYSAELDGGWQHVVSSEETRKTQFVAMPVSALPDLSDCREDNGKVTICPAGVVIDGDDFEVQVRDEVILELKGHRLVFAPTTVSGDQEVRLVEQPVIQ